ncbi:thioesterase family protein [Petroclostridium sp. X23]|uniref:thioesterase family protein n=1 Tax=Petroclostridium sp. X23 TaxID=3045146 RepID=UPI0024AD9415|nr:thioesterase family protein [Petroclostridium sp. X23]WHH57561.1 thioesterase family protein [Petroclostridium sp. X23]
MSDQLKIGLEQKVEMIVSEQLTAKEVGSGAVEVFATPMMIALMEKAAAQCVQPYLEETQATVGTRVDISHMAATPVGVKVYAQAELKEIDKKKLVFSVEAFDEKGKIGEGTHERFIIDVERFMNKVNTK